VENGKKKSMWTILSYWMNGLTNPILVKSGAGLLKSAGVSQDNLLRIPDFVGARCALDAANGDVSVMTVAGIALLSGFGTERDPQAGTMWLKRASAAAGPEASQAMYRLAEINRYGVGVDADRAKAKGWKRRAVRAAAMSPIALDLEIENTQASRTRTIRWFQRAQALRPVQSGRKLRRMGMGAEGSPALQLEEVGDDGVEE
jgi:TPR repeat protein